MKDKLHELIDQIEDENILIDLYKILSGLGKNKNGNLYDALTEDQRKELFVAHEESFDKSYLISNDEVKSKLFQ